MPVLALVLASAVMYMSVLVSVQGYLEYLLMSVYVHLSLSLSTCMHVVFLYVLLLLPTPVFLIHTMIIHRHLGPHSLKYLLMIEHIVVLSHLHT